MVYLKQLMKNGQVHIPYDRELINQLNVEQYEMMKTGQIRFDHPTGTHDDKVWAFALAVYASRPEVPEYRGTVIRGKSRRLMIGLPRKGSWEEKFKTRQEWHFENRSPEQRRDMPKNLHRIFEKTTKLADVRAFSER